MDQGDDGGLERALDDIDGRVESFKGDGAAVVQVQGGGDDHYVIVVRARARLILIPDPIQGFPLWTEREENTKSTSFLAATRLSAVWGPAPRGKTLGAAVPSSCCVSFSMLVWWQGEPWTGIRKPKLFFWLWR